MKILLCVHGFPPELRGGTENTVEALARAFLAAGHEVVVVAGVLAVSEAVALTRDVVDGLSVCRLARDDLYHDGWIKAHAPAVSARFAELLAAERPDVVHVHHWVRLTSDLARIARRAGALTAVTLHDYYSVLATPVRRIGATRAEPPEVPAYVGAAERAEAFAFHRRDFAAELAAAHLLCAPSGAHARGLAELSEGALGEVAVTPPPLLRSPPRRPPQPAPRGRRLLVWGALYPEKGLEVVLAAMRRAADEWSLEVWGEAHDAAYREQLHAAAAGLRVEFRGGFTTEDLAGSDADYAVLASCCHESYGLILDEALLLGLPVLASDLPAYREHGAEGSCAWFAPGDARALAELLDDGARLSALAVPQPPRLQSAADAAAQLQDLYERAHRGEAGPAADGVTDADRVALLFRRAERRLWSALQQREPPPAPK